MCVYSDHWAFGNVDGCIGEECHHCDEVCEHNSDYDYETDSLIKNDAISYED
jgi:hypothetical protein